MIKRIIKAFKDVYPLFLFGIVLIMLFYLAMSYLPIPFDELTKYAPWLYFCCSTLILIICAIISLGFTDFFIKKI